jgi:methionyl-tRNA formyltransferase
VAAHLLQETLTGWWRREVEPQPQNDSEAIYSARITREEGEIDWHLSAEEIWRRVRAFNPWPRCYTRWRGRELKVLGAVPLPGEGVSGIGQVVTLAGGRVVLGVGTGDGILGLLEVQLEGKRAMPAAEFLKGQRDFVGAVLPG